MKNEAQKLREQAIEARKVGRTAESVKLYNQAFELESAEKAAERAAERNANMQDDIARVSNIIKFRNSRVIRISADPGGHSKRTESPPEKKPEDEEES